MATLPAELKRSPTWDQGSEMGLHHQFSITADLPVYFCDPHSPWQRGSNETTNGLLRQYFPRAPTCPSTAPSTSQPSAPASTAGHAKRSAVKPSRASR
jgi:transposase, IS30 family